MVCDFEVRQRHFDLVEKSLSLWCHGKEVEPIRTPAGFNIKDKRFLVGS